jgi:hypothetical protein
MQITTTHGSIEGTGDDGSGGGSISRAVKWLPPMDSRPPIGGGIRRGGGVPNINISGISWRLCVSQLGQAWVIFDMRALSTWRICSSVNGITPLSHMPKRIPCQCQRGGGKLKWTDDQGGILPPFVIKK